MPKRKRHYPWVNYNPGRFNIRKIVDGARTSEHLENERACRATILDASDDEVHQRMAETLEATFPGLPVRVCYCPINTQSFQIYQTAEVLKVINDFDDVRMITVLDRDDEIAPDLLHSLNWRRLHARLRHRLKSTFGDDAIAFGAGEVDFDDKTGLFRPHHHVFVAGVGKRSLRRFRRWYPEAGTLEVDELPTLKERATAISYALKNIAYRHPFEQFGRKRTNVRLHPREFRLHMEYLAKHDFRDFCFWLNHRTD